MITINCSIDAPIEKVWLCWNSPEHIKNWYFASDDWHAPHAENDLRPGGNLKITMAAKDGSFSFDFEATYDNIVDQKKIDYTILDGRKVEVVFTEEGNQTLVSESFEAETQHSEDLQRTGWQAILNNFKQYVERTDT